MMSHILLFTYLLNNSILQDDYHKAKKSKMLAETLQDVRHINFCFYKINVQIWNTDILINAIVLKVKKIHSFPFLFLILNNSTLQDDYHKAKKRKTFSEVQLDVRHLK